MCPSCFCTTLCNLAGIWLSHLKKQIVQPHIQAAPFSVKERKIAGSTQKLLYFAFHVCFHLCALQFSKWLDSPNQHKSIFFPSSPSSSSPPQFYFFFPKERLSKRCLYFLQTPHGTDWEGRQEFVLHLFPKCWALHLICRVTAVVTQVTGRWPCPFPQGKVMLFPLCSYCDKRHGESPFCFKPNS